MVADFRTKFKAYDNEAAISDATQLLTSFGVSEKSLAGLVVGTHNKTSWSLAEQLPVILKQIPLAEKKLMRNSFL